MNCPNPTCQNTNFYIEEDQIDGLDVCVVKCYGCYRVVGIYPDQTELLKTIKELKSTVDDLESRVSDLE